MRLRQLGTTGPRVSRIGLGCTAAPETIGHLDFKECISTLHAAIDEGINLLDTGDLYGMGHNDILIGRALQGQRNHLIVAVQFGALCGADGGSSHPDARPESLRKFLTYTLKRLGTDYVDIYRPVSIDEAVPVEESAGAVADLIQEGLVRFLGLSETSIETVARVQKVCPVVDMQTEYSVTTHSVADRMRPALRELGVALTAYGVLPRGLILEATVEGSQERSVFFPSVLPGEAVRSGRLVHLLGELSADYSISIAQLAIAWALQQGDDIFALIGAQSRRQLKEALAATRVKLTADTLRALDRMMEEESAARASRQQPSLIVPGVEH